VIMVENSTTLIPAKGCVASVMRSSIPTLSLQSAPDHMARSSRRQAQDG
jgi:hypothetical protein